MVSEELKNQKELNDGDVEKLWNEFEDVTLVEDDKNELVLSSAWFVFESGTSRTEIWQWFDKSHTQGVAWLHDFF